MGLGETGQLRTTDNIFIMRQILEKCYEYNTEMHVLFIDFKQAFDSVDTQKIIQILQELRISNKLVRLSKMTIQNTEASVKIENLTSKPFLISSGVRQGDPLSATIFNLTLRRLMSYIYGAPILDVSRSHTTTQHSR